MHTPTVIDELNKRIDALAAENERLRGALERIRKMSANANTCEIVGDIASAALAPEENP